MVKLNLTILLSVCFVFLVSCSESEANGNDIQKDEETELTKTYEAEAELELEDEVDSLPEILWEVPEPTVEDACLPYPSEDFKAQLQRATTPYLDANFLYAYVVAHFDSLGPKQYTPMEDEYHMGVYDWTQEFSDGIIYSEYFGGEGGAQATLKTSCTNFEAVFSTLNALVNRRNLYYDWEYEGYWNEKRTAYGPEGAGCYYDIFLNDSTGFYYISNYCGC